MDLKDVLKRPIITEKAMDQVAWGKFAFEVDVRANRTQVTQAVRQLFKVHPVSVKIMKVKGKIRRSRRTNRRNRLPDWKKAIVTLKEGEKIDLFEAGE